MLPLYFSFAFSSPLPSSPLFSSTRPSFTCKLLLSINYPPPPSSPSLLPCPRPPPPPTGLPPLLSLPHFTCLSNTINSCETFLTLRSRLQWLFLCHAQTCTLFFAACAPTHARTDGGARAWSRITFVLSSAAAVFFFFFLAATTRTSAK